MSTISAAGEPASIREVIGAQIRDPGTQWSAGTFGAIAEFSRDTLERTDLRAEAGSVSAATGKGAVSVSQDVDDVRLVAYETLSRNVEVWRHSVALCLPAAASAMHRRSVLTELGPDARAVRSEHRNGILFDLGLALPQTDACVRTSDPVLLAALRSGVGKELFDPSNPALMAILQAGPHRVFVTRVARVEVFQPIPPPHGKSPAGPHTHILPKLMRSGRTHAATVPIPEGWVPCANFYPPHARLDHDGDLRDFDARDFAAFDAVLERFGNPDLVSLQRSAAEAIQAGCEPCTFPQPTTKFERMALRVALRKLRAQGSGSAALGRWWDHFERPEIADDEEETQHAC